jgi:ribonuclease HI
MQSLLLSGLSDKQQQSPKGKTRGRLDLPLYYLYTDGSSSHVTNEGGWAFIVIDSNHDFFAQGYGYELNATNNSMELKAAIEGIKFLSEKQCEIELFSDSAYMINSIKNSWWKDWEQNDWVKRNGQVTPNSFLWKELVTLLDINPVEFIKVKAHSGDKLNDYCDKLAKEARKNQGVISYTNI